MRRQRLILVTIDCLRADHVGWLGYRRPTTPFLDSLAHESVVFTNAIVAGAPTYYSFPAIMASRYPLALGRDVLGLAPGEPTLASILQNLGYSTAAFLAGNPYLSKSFGYDQGFDTFEDHLSDQRSDGVPAPQHGALSRANRWLHEHSRNSWLEGLYDEAYFQYSQKIARLPAASFETLRRFPSANEIVDQAIGWINEHAHKPFFLWLHFMDPHSPYYPTSHSLDLLGLEPITPDRARYLNSFWNRGRVSETRLRRHRDEIVDLYDAGIRSVDHQLSRLVSTLVQGKIWDSCVLAATADHGEEFLDHGRRFHSPSQVGEELIRVPLLIRVPEMKNAATVSSPFSLLNLAPTLLAALDIESPQTFAGTDCWPGAGKDEEWNNPAIVEGVSQCSNPFREKDRLGERVLVIRENRYKLVTDFAKKEEMLFDLEADPNEQSPVPDGVATLVRQRLLKVARDHIARSHKSRDLDSALKARLRDMQLNRLEDTRVQPAVHSLP